MKYNLIPSGGKNNSDNFFIYVLPNSFERSSYSIAYPSCKVEDILSQNLTIRKFDGCSPDAILDITTQLKERLRKKNNKYSERLNTFFTAGTGILILGIINWVIPDPLPFVDELIFTVFGGITAWKAWKDRKVKLPLLMEQTYRYGYDNYKPDVETDTILTTIFKSIRSKIDPIEAGDVIKDMDRIEIESLWITKYLNIQDLILSGEFTVSGIKDFIQVIERVLPITKMVKLEGGNKNKKVSDGLEKLKKEIIHKTGIGYDALAVYIEFYRGYLEYKLI